MRNHPDFQISLTSQQLQRPSSNNDSKITFGTDFDSSTLNESKFRQGLETSKFQLSDQEGEEK